MFQMLFEWDSHEEGQQNALTHGYETEESSMAWDYWSVSYQYMEDKWDKEKKNGPGARVVWKRKL